MHIPDGYLSPAIRRQGTTTWRLHSPRKDEALFLLKIQS